MPGNSIIKVENVSKLYRLGIIGSSSLREDFESWWYRIRGKPDPAMRAGRDSKYSNYIWAVRDISFEVREGEVLGIIGRNGAGKSTLLKILSRVTAPTSGRIIINGRIASLLEVGTGFHPELTGRENIFLNGAILGMTRREIKNKFDEIVSFAEVEQFIDTPVKRYSSGMYVRLAFAVAAHLEPEILIIDEVLAVGDAEFQKKCLGKMDDVSKEGRTVLFVSHNMAAIEMLCNRSILLDNGFCKSDGETAAVINEYLNLVPSATKGELQFGEDTLRSGSGKAQYTRVRLLNKDGAVIPSIPMGDGLTIELAFECNRDIFRPIFGVSLRSALNLGISGWKTHETHGDMPSASKKGIVCLHIEGLNLLPGIYYFSLGLSDGHEQYDLIENAIEIEVTPKPVYPTGKIPSSRRAIMFTPCSWTYEYE